MRCKPVLNRKQGKVLGRFQRESLVLYGGRLANWITTDGGHIIARATSIDEITNDWNECQQIYLEEAARLGITQFSSAYLLILYEREYAKKYTSNLTRLPATTEDSNSELLEQIILDMENGLPKNQLGVKLREHKTIFSYSDSLGRSILHRAAAMENYEIVDYVIKRGKECLDLDHKDNSGSTVLHEICKTSNFKIAELLIEQNASILAVDHHGATPIHYLVSVNLPTNSIIFQFRKLFLLCMENGFAINAQDFNGDTPLHYATRKSNIGAINCILDEKAKYIVNREGETAKHIAAKLGDKEICAIFMTYQAASPGHFEMRLNQSTNELRNTSPSDLSSNLSPIDILQAQLAERLRGTSEPILNCKSDSQQVKIKKQGAAIHRFCVLNLLKSRGCALCGSKIIGNCFGCSVCNITVHSGKCRKEAIFSSVCAAPTPENTPEAKRRAFKIDSAKPTPLLQFTSAPEPKKEKPFEVLSSNGLFSEEELRCIYDEYLQAESNSNGIVGYEDFMKHCGPIFGAPGSGEFLFRLFDKECKGEIEFPEYLQTFSVLFKGTPEEKLTLAFGGLCNFETKLLSNDDLEEVIRGIAQVLRSFMNLNFLKVEKFLNELLERLSEGGSEAVSCKQFIERATNHLIFIESLGSLSDEDPLLHQQALDTFQSEKCITFGHKYWSLIQYLMIGLRMSITETEALYTENEDLVPEDFQETVSIRLFRKDDKTDDKWTFHDTARKIFAKIRRMAGTTKSSYQFSLGPERMLGNLLLGNLSTLAEVCSTGRSGSVFFKSMDNRYLLKTLPPAEVALLKRMLPKYLQHLEKYPNSLLTRFFGIHSLESSQDATTYDLVVMENLFCSLYGINEQYDLKGSKVDRHVEVDEVTSDVARKDLDFERTLNLSIEAKTILLEQVERDCKFLERNNLCDYSLLVGIHFFAEDGALPLANEGHMRFFKKDFGGIMSADGKELYFLGIIDTLTCYSLQKRSERALKVVLNFTEKDAISAMSPTPYRQRFQKYIASILA